MSEKKMRVVRSGSGSGKFVEYNGKLIEVLNCRSGVEINGKPVWLDEMTELQRRYVVTMANINGMRDYYARRGLVERPVVEYPPFEELFAEYL